MTSKEKHNKIKVYLRVRPKIEREDSNDDTFDYMKDNQGW